MPTVGTKRDCPTTPPICTARSIWEPRRRAAATVSTPVRWDELESVYPTDFTLRTVPDRLEAGGDPWGGILEAKQDLGAILSAGGAV